MKKLIIWAGFVTAVLGTGSVSALQNHNVELNPMVLIELHADMKGDLVFAERMMALEIKDDLQAQSDELLKIELLNNTEIVLKSNIVHEQEWLIAAND